MAKSWMKKNRMFDEYELGIQTFLELEDKLCQRDGEIARMDEYIFQLEDTLNKHEETESSKESQLKRSIEVEDIAGDSDSLQAGTLCRLASGSKKNIVAAGTILQDNGEVLLVSIDLVVHGECPVPISIEGEDNILSQAIGSHLQWPRHLVILDKDKDMKCNDDPISATLGDYQSAPIACRCLFSVLKRIKSSIQLKVAEGVFGRNVKCSIWLDLLKDFCEMSPIGTSTIDAYILCLHEQVLGKEMKNIFKFLDAGSISISNNKDVRVKVLTKRIEGLDKNELLLVPYNSRNHWILIVIDPSKCLVQWMDPLTNRLPEDVNEVIGSSFKSLKLKKPQWKLVKGPRQPGVVECGYYILKYMKEIVLQNKALIHDIMKDAPKSYTQYEIDLVRSEWAEYVVKHVYFA